MRSDAESLKMSVRSTKSDMPRPKSATFGDDIPTKVRTGNRLSMQHERTDNLEIPEVSRHKRTNGVGRSASTVRATVSIIDEEKVLETVHHDDPAQRFERNNSVTTSATKNPYRKTSRSEKSHDRVNGVVNNGFCGSRNPSAYSGSVASLPVINEQYCSCSRWSKLEKILITVVGILAFTIVCLLIAVGVLAGGKSGEKQWWAW